VAEGIKFDFIVVCLLKHKIAAGLNIDSLCYKIAPYLWFIRVKYIIETPFFVTILPIRRACSIHHDMQEFVLLGWSYYRICEITKNRTIWVKNR
jgi:hypothetical protein